MPTHLPTVVLRHDLPDGSHHFDWLLANDPQGSQPLTTFRMPRPVHELAAGATIEALRLPDHRPRYLDYEGPVAGGGPSEGGGGAGEGRVSRLARGRIDAQLREREPWRLQVTWDGGEGVRAGQRKQWLELRQVKDERWLAACIRVSGPHR